jgi:hypothetical protein
MVVRNSKVCTTWSAQGSLTTLGTIALDDSSSVGEDDWILSYLMTLSDSPQSVQFLQIGNQQTGASFLPNSVQSIIFTRVCGPLQAPSSPSMNG